MTPMRSAPLALPLISAALLALVGCAARGSAGDHRLRAEYIRAFELPYRVYLPSDYPESDERRPLLLFLHGAGERGANLDDLERTGLPKLIAEQKLDLPFVVVAPQCPADEWWDPHALARLLEHVIGAYNVDPDRVYLTGLSMGGTGVWMFAAEYPERFAAIAPICGRTLPLRAAPLTTMPIWVFHGDADNVVDISNSETQVRRLREAGAKEARLTIYPGVNHNAWDRTYANPELYEWMLSHRRSLRQ